MASISYISHVSVSKYIASLKPLFGTLLLVIGVSSSTYAMQFQAGYMPSLQLAEHSPSKAQRPYQKSENPSVGESKEASQGQKSGDQSEGQIYIQPIYLLPPPDDDMDGVANSHDYCPQTDNSFPINQYGCYLDSDGDGYVDQSDRCPRTPYGSQVDHHGCSVEMKHLSKSDQRKQDCTLEKTNEVRYRFHVLFAHNSSVVDTKYYKNIEEVADKLKQHDYQFVWIEGHTDSLGDAAYNKMLSTKRAQSVAQLLMDKFGIEQSSIGIKGYGEEKPIAENLLKEGRRQNRRVIAAVETCR